jgi:biofilm protein TabA
MILDRLENAERHGSLGAEIALAFDYLRRTDFTGVASGRYTLDGDRVYAIVQRYRPKPLADALWEAHRRYVDVQYMAAGSERMGCTPLQDGLTIQKGYDPDGDAILFRADGELFRIDAGSFVIFTPDDVHAPGLAIDGPDSAGEVCKVVVKCRLAQS